MEDKAHEFLDRHIDQGTMDLALDYASPVPAILTMRLMGLPLDNWHLYAGMFHNVRAVPQDSPEYADAIAKVPAMMEEVLQHAAQRRADQSEDLTSFLIQFEFEGKASPIPTKSSWTEHSTATWPSDLDPTDASARTWRG